MDLTYVLSLYPSIHLPKAANIAEPEMDLPDGSQLVRVYSDASDEIESSSFSQLQEPDDKSILEAKKMNHNALMALVKYLQKKRHGIIERATAEVTEEVVSDAVQDSIMSSDPYKSKISSKVANQYSLICFNISQHVLLYM